LLLCWPLTTPPGACLGAPSAPSAAPTGRRVVVTSVASDEAREGEGTSRPRATAASSTLSRDGEPLALPAPSCATRKAADCGEAEREREWETPAEAPISPFSPSYER